MEIDSTFVNGFEGLWRRPMDDYKHAIQNYTIVIDTNVLLDLYRFNPGARKELLEILREVRDRLWIPHQVAREYFSRRVDALKDQLDLFNSVPRELETLHNRAITQVNNFARRCSLSEQDKQSLVTPLQQALTSVTSEIERHRKELDLTLEKVASEDPILEDLAAILDDRTGKPFQPEEEGAFIEAYTERAKAQIPPGYRDAGKSENAHGDYFVWEQMIKRSVETKAPTLFVTSDVKEDWFYKSAGITVGARPELISEMRERANTDFLIQQLSSFLRAARESLGAQVSEATYEAAKNVSLELRREEERETHHFAMPHPVYEAILSHLKNLVSHAMEELRAAEKIETGRPHSIEHAVNSRLVTQRRESVRTRMLDLETFRGCPVTFSMPDTVDLFAPNRSVARMIENLIETVEYDTVFETDLPESPVSKGGPIWAKRLENALAPYIDNYTIRSVSRDSVSFNVDEFSNVDTDAIRGIAKSFDVDIHLLTPDGLGFTARARR
ncbi:PIN domain-containing protein [Streptomyces olivaceus]|uniref:PIN domain-containing protein n=1 Tax=Streptomyces olivaceus TaxID=47716 RepID=UPI0018859246|nr:PIN domain-containing protein [Streptomyces olivaceus]MBZ6135385.1 DUF4935 domain-containing protein [Streptomyces olivaceus]